MIFFFNYTVSFVKGQKLVWSQFVEVAERHLDSGSPTGGLQELHEAAELWVFNTDFSLEFPQPLMPNTVLMGGLLNQPAKPVDQVSCLIYKHINDILSLHLSHSRSTTDPCRILNCGFPALVTQGSLL